MFVQASQSLPMESNSGFESCCFGIPIAIGHVLLQTAKATERGQLGVLTSTQALARIARCVRASRRLLRDARRQATDTDRRDGHGDFDDSAEEMSTKLMEKKDLPSPEVAKLQCNLGSSCWQALGNDGEQAL